VDGAKPTQTWDAAEAALRQAQSTRQALDVLLTEHFDRLQDVVGTLDKPSSSAVSGNGPGASPISSQPRRVSPPGPEGGRIAKPAEQAPGPPSINPEWQGLCDQIDELAARRATLLVTRTPAHPEVVDIEQKTADLQAQLQKTPRHLPEGKPTAVSDPHAAKADRPTHVGETELLTRLDPANDETAPNARPENAASDREEVRATTRAVEEYRVLKEADDRAWRQYRQAVRAVRPAREDTGASDVERAWIDTPAHLAQRCGGAMPLWQVAIVSLIAMGGGLVLAMAAGMPNPGRGLGSIDEVERRLRLPVVGAISTGDGPPLSSRGWPSRKIVPLLTIGCELLLAAVVVVFILLIVSDRDSAARFVENPLRLMG